jgi:hypothetical protein
MYKRKILKKQLIEKLHKHYVFSAGVDRVVISITDLLYLLDDKKSDIEEYCYGIDHVKILLEHFQSAYTLTNI